MKIKYCFGKKVKTNLIQITGEGQPVLLVPITSRA
jgi:hypothetical protein